MNKQEYKIFVAKEIVNQIRAFDPFAMMAWGSKNLTALDESKLEHGYRLGGLQFNVNGMKFKGLVSIHLMGNDTYTVELGKITKGEYKSKSLNDNVYCDELMNTIDRLIERDV